MKTRLETVAASHPTWVRGLKLNNLARNIFSFLVAPYMGAWIEIRRFPKKYRFTFVSHPTWVRGLKCWYAVLHKRVFFVAPYMGAWIEIIGSA